MKERGILMTGAMVRSTLDNMKTMTRRVAKTASRHGGGAKDTGPTWATSVSVGMHSPEPEDPRVSRVFGALFRNSATGANQLIPCPHGQPGDRLWVREAHYVESAGYKDGSGRRILYRATEPDASISKWTPGIHMFRWASRITLEITDVRVERLQSITRDGAIREGIERADLSLVPADRQPGPFAVWRDYGDPSNWLAEPTASFRSLWDSLNAKRGYGWDVNPWCWAISFRVVTP